MIYVSNIQPHNEALIFIDNRINDDCYRGNISSEHNRYDCNEIWKTLYILDKIRPNKELLQIRDTDLSRRPQNTTEEYDYALFCQEVNKEVGKGTQDSIRKNIFVDLERMGFIRRYDKNHNIIDCYKKSSPKYVSLTDKGLNFIQSTDILNQSMIFTSAIDKLLKGYIQITLHILENNYGINDISIYEFMFFVTAVNTNTTFNIDILNCIKLIKSYRSLSSFQKNEVIERLTQKLQPQNFQGDKKSKRDWYNWKNKIDQIYHLFKQIPYFNIIDDKIKLGTRETIVDNEKITLNKVRNIQEKEKYFNSHNINKTNGFELHHIVPLLLAKNPQQYKLLDNWQNMIYIDAYSHAIITQTKNINIILQIDNSNIILKNYSGENDIILNYDNNIHYNPELQKKMITYNQQLLNTGII